MTMSDATPTQSIPATKAARQALIRKMLSTQNIHSQGELALELRTMGIEVTQATLSRDLVDIGAIKVRRGDGEYAYASGDDRDGVDDAESRLDRLCEELLFSAEASANLAVLRVPSGAAQFFASAIDGFEDDQVLGTVAGDDTVFVVARDAMGGHDLAQRFLDRAGRRRTSA